MKDKLTDMTRRSFVCKTTCTGGLLMGWQLLPAFESQAFAQGGGFQPNIWLEVSSSNEFRFILDKTEMGQGVHTSLPMILAEEFDVNPTRLDVVAAPADRKYINTGFGSQLTGGSTSIPVMYEPLRRAGATARRMLLGGAAKHWGVAVSACSTDDGTISLQNTSKTMSYGEATAFVDAASEPEVKLKDPKDFKWLGKAHRRLDNFDKTTGRAEFGIDVKVPNAKVALILRSPDIGGKPFSFDDAKAKATPGYLRSVMISNGVAVIADKFWQAKQAAALIAVRWQPGPLAGKTSQQIEDDFIKALDKEGSPGLERGDWEDAVAKAESTVDATYILPYLAHATMEPQNATAFVQKDRCEIWAPTQGPGAAQQLAVELTGLDHDQVFVHTKFMGGGFGRRINQDYIAEAVETSKIAEVPVKVIWTREDDMRHSPYRPFTAHKLRGIVNADGELKGWFHRVASQSILREFFGSFVPTSMPVWVPEGVKSLMARASTTVFDWFDEAPIPTEGAADLPYAIETAYVDVSPVQLPIPVAFWRSVGHSHNGFVVESFFDELAHKAGKDPLVARRELLKDQPRHLAVLELAAMHAEWGKPKFKGASQGIAVHKSFNSYVAQIAEVKVIDGTIKVLRVVCAVDCGAVVNPSGVMAQAEGGINFGLTAALYGAIDINDGKVQQSNFHDYQILRATEAPEIEVHIIDSNEPPTGMGEPAVPPIAAAVGNAIYAATGQRLRRLPFELA